MVTSTSIGTVAIIMSSIIIVINCWNNDAGRVGTGIDTVPFTDRLAVVGVCSAHILLYDGVVVVVMLLRMQRSGR